MPVRGPYAVATQPDLHLVAAERELILIVRKVQRETGFGEVRVTVKNGEITVVRREHIVAMVGEGMSGS